MNSYENMNMTELQISYTEPEIINAVNTYAGKTYFLFPDSPFAEIDECKWLVRYYGLRDFSSVPSSMSQVFHCINSNCIFFKRIDFLNMVIFI